MTLQKLQYFLTKVLVPFHFFDGSGPNFFCGVNGLSVMLLVSTPHLENVLPSMKKLAFI